MTSSPEQRLLHEQRLPGESEDYRQARDELLSAELELRRQTEAVAAKRRELPPGGAVPEDYVFQEWDPAVGRPREHPFGWRLRSECRRRRQSASKNCEAQPCKAISNSHTPTDYAAASHGTITNTYERTARDFRFARIRRPYVDA